MLDWDTVRRLDRSGLVEIGAHGHTHRQLDVLSARDLPAEIDGPKRRLEGQLGHPIAGFAYPHGYSSRRVREAVAAAGFTSACAVKHALSGPGDDRYALGRIVVDADTTVEALEGMLRGAGLRVAPRDGARVVGWRLLRRAHSQVAAESAAEPLADEGGGVIACSLNASRDEWEGVAASDPEVLVTQTSAWMDAICMSGQWIDVTRQYEVDGRRIVVPLARRVPTMSALTVDASPPNGWGFGGLIGDGGVRAAEDVAVVLDDLARHPGLRLSIRPNPLQRDRWPPFAGIRIGRRAHVLDLRPGTDAIWASMRARTQIRKANRHVDIETDVTGRLLPVFFDLLDLSRERWARQQHEPLWLARWRGRRLDPLAKWRRIAATLGDRCRVSIAWTAGRPAAGLIVLQGHNADYTRGAMDYELAAPTCANAGLQWKAICDAVDAGCWWYHMGESGTSQSLSRFKEQLGARAHDYLEYRFERLPLTRVDHAARGALKRLVGFQEQ